MRPYLIPMVFDRHKHHRRSIRLRGRDYARPGTYFVTLCTYYRECLFGTVDIGGVRLSEWGLVAREEWLRSAQVRPGVILDAFVIMPNHLHGIITLTRESQSADADVGAHSRAPLPRSPLRRQPRSLASFVACYKATTTRRINRSRDTPGARVWQRNYYERVIRDDEEAVSARIYIRDNPSRWPEDDYYVP